MASSLFGLTARSPSIRGKTPYSFPAKRQLLSFLKKQIREPVSLASFSINDHLPAAGLMTDFRPCNDIGIPVGKQRPGIELTIF